MATTTQEIIGQVQRKLGHPVYNPTSNSAVARVLGISHTWVKRLIAGDGVLGRDAFVRAAKFLELSPEAIVDYTLRLDADGADDEGLRAFMRSVAKGLRGTVVKGGASILLGATAMLAHVDDARASGKLVFSAHSSAEARFPGMYIMVTRMFRFLRRFLPAPVHHIAMA